MFYDAAVSNIIYGCIMGCKLESYARDSHCINISSCIKADLLSIDNTPTVTLVNLLAQLKESKPCEIAVQDMVISDEVMIVLQYIATNMPWLHRIKKENIDGLWAEDEYFDSALKSAFHNQSRYRLTDLDEFKSQLNLRPKECLPCEQQMFFTDNSIPGNNDLVVDRAQSQEISASLVDDGVDAMVSDAATDAPAQSAPKELDITNNLYSLLSGALIAYAIYYHAHYMDDPYAM